MVSNESPCYGPKLDRLLRILATDSLKDLVPPTVPIAPLPTAVPAGSAREDEAISAYAVSLADARPRLAQQVEALCGPAPWIVRSAGIEDMTDDVNAGAYESLICAAPEDLVQRIAAVALSGSTEHARRQAALSGRFARWEAIPCFVQPLVKIDVAPDVDLDHSPYLTPATLARMEAVCAELMEIFGFPAIDCEWGLETTLGFVSVTTITPRDVGVMNIAHTIGFGFASAQSTGSRATTLALSPAGTELRLWRGTHFRETTVQRLHLLQARPADVEVAFRERTVLTDDCYEALSRHYDVVDAGLLILGEKSFGHALIATDLLSAWRRYLALGEWARAAVTVVMVDEGSAEEHAGIMFRQQKITCVKVQTRLVPAGADCVVYDRGSCVLGDPTMLRSLRTEVRRELILPDDCAVVFTDEVLKPTGELCASCADILSQLHALPLANDVKARLLRRTEHPMPRLWMQRLDGSVESPSLLARIWRSRHAGYAGSRSASTPFAKSYERAVRVSRREPWPELPALCALSGAIPSLVESADLRLIIALLDCEEAASWVRPETLTRLLDLAAAQLDARQRDSAVLVLSSISLISAQCACLPLYETDEMASYASALSCAFASGLAVKSMGSVYSLELPVSSVARLVQQFQDHSAVLESVETFRQARASFRGTLSVADAMVRSSTRLNDAYSNLLEALCRADLKNVAEQIRGSLIETYDASLKALLTRAVQGPDIDSYRRYLALMQQWIALLGMATLSERDDEVLRRFQAWLCEWAGEAMPRSFDIEDRNWRSEFAAIGAGGEAALRYENPHVLHNLLHQWSLAGVCLDARQLPRRVRSLERFCSTFSSRATKVLRFERELLEIQIPMGTHKASYVFTPRQITVEWTEPPDCPGDEIARILAFEVLLDRLRAWMFESMVVRREQVLGTWTLFIRLGAPASSLWHHEDLTRFVAATRFLFDAAYDFSYVGNEAVQGLAERLNGPAWASIVATLIQYRTVLDDASQYVALHTLPMSSTIGAIAQSRVVRGLLLRCLRAGADENWALIDRYAHWLTHCEAGDHRWHDRYESLRQASLFLAAMWPREALAKLSRRSSFHIGHDLVAACLFKRSDLKVELRRIMADGGSALSGACALIVRHAPEIAVASVRAAPLAALLAGTGAHFRRAKHFIVAHVGDRIEPSVLGRLLQQMDTIPWGHSETVEEAIQAQISTREPILRFELERGIDWTTLDSWATIGTPRHNGLSPAA